MAAGNGEGIDVRIVDDAKLERQVGDRCLRMDALANRADVGVGHRIVDKVDLLRDLRGHLLSKLPFLLTGYARSAG